MLPISAFAWNLQGDFLYWKPSEETSLLWASALRFDEEGTEIFQGENLSLDWNAGFRVGLGSEFGCDCWNAQLVWTQFTSSGKNSIPRNQAVIATQFFGGFINGDISDSAEINLKLKYNMFDLELGREIDIGHCFTMQPKIGVKGGWIDQSIHTEWSNFVVEPPSQFTATEDLTNDFWGVGPLAGLEMRWGLGACFYLFGNFDAAFLWGTWKNRDVYKSSEGREINTNMKNSQLGELVVRGLAGLGWEVPISDWAFLVIQLGYEGQNWFEQFRIPTFQQLRVHGDLTLQGGTLKVCLEF